VVEERAHNEVHTLHVVDLLVIVGIGFEDSFELLYSSTAFFEIVMLGKSSVKITLDLVFRLFFDLNLVDEVSVESFLLLVVKDLPTFLIPRVRFLAHVRSLGRRPTRADELRLG